MCLAVPGKVIEFEPTQQWAVIETFGLTRKVGTHLIGDVELGDYLIVHAGFAIEKLDVEEAMERIRLWKELFADEEQGKGE